MSNLTLRIKRVYFDEILSGRKKIEYRAVKPFYERLLEKRKYETLTLHYQQKRVLRARILKIERVPTPSFFKLENDGIEFGAETYAIIIENAELIRS